LDDITHKQVGGARTT